MYACVNTAHAQAPRATKNLDGKGTLTSKTKGNSSPSNTTSANNQSGQNTQSNDTIKEDPCIPLNDARRCFRLDPMTGLVFESVPDTTFLNLGNRQSMESKALALIHTGNLYSPHQVEAYFDRRTSHDVMFLNAYNLFRFDPSQQLYYNSKLPCTILSYSKEGGGLQTNDHLKINFFGNFNKQFGIGTNLDYVYARGEYPESSAKPLKWNSYTYYENDQYKAYASFTLSKLANQENGGITDRELVLHPDNFKENFTDPKNLATNLVSTWNDTDQRQIHFQHSYDLGKWEERFDPADSSYWDEFIPVASIFHSIDFEYLHHVFRMDDGADASEYGYFKNHYYNKSNTLDSTSYRDFTTYAGIRLNEGFNKFSQFSLSAFLGFEHQRYTMLADTLHLDFIDRSHSSNTLWAGGQLSRHLTPLLNFDATARIAVNDGDKRGNVDVNGNLRMVIPLGSTSDGTAGDSAIFEAKGSFQNTRMPYMMLHYFSNHFKWDNEKAFKSEQRNRVEGKLSYPRSLSSVRFCFEHINNYHYFDSTFMPKEYNKQMDVFGLELRQGVRAGKWLQWDNAVLVQYTTHKEILPLPQVSIESDLSLHFRIAKTLSVQAGVAAYYHTRYYTPTYQPATQQFALQERYKCGNYPLLNGYVNCNLKRIKFFLTAHNMLENFINNDMFLMPFYPVQTRRIEYGLILDLQN